MFKSVMTVLENITTSFSTMWFSVDPEAEAGSWPTAGAPVCGHLTVSKHLLCHRVHTQGPRDSALPPTKHFCFGKCELSLKTWPPLVLKEI